ncbi:hypothetical protein [Candidatus Uabimicrobium amorphum]|uniref:Uncharacterized protein n=2 Tax=Uabimicrobium amorphum TaxID=2596890 RepID=A0A5S9F4D0_UABAM|nr:hypothetical protein UABAM_02820 [Candidatus Uabimicrobium amorphum]
MQSTPIIIVLIFCFTIPLAAQNQSFERESTNIIEQIVKQNNQNQSLEDKELLERYRNNIGGTSSIQIEKSWRFDKYLRDRTQKSQNESNRRVSTEKTSTKRINEIAKDKEKKKNKQDKLKSKHRKHRFKMNTHINSQEEIKRGYVNEKGFCYAPRPNYGRVVRIDGHSEKKYTVTKRTKEECFTVGTIFYSKTTCDITDLKTGKKTRTVKTCKGVHLSTGTPLYGATRTSVYCEKE